ncbi:hypothetical protein GDO86_014063 [Hymenochirus boettgeri]|uniref:Zinc transporter ZIP11 n=1 Tax=Hymenochirus boettgeri TaxID=247094 RepID=A0A8T2JMM5_9PIPI|nr:hypothetical protein GDO86_014063 [Hymenochirus boettgeri]
MIEGYSPVVQSLLGTLLTWGLTAAGAALVFVFSTGQRRILDGSLGFAAGVMLAASYWSLLAPAIEMAEDSKKYGSFSFLPAALGFSIGAGFVYLADQLLPALGISEDPYSFATLNVDSKPIKEKDEGAMYEDRDLSIRIDKIENGEVYQRKRGNPPTLAEESPMNNLLEQPQKGVSKGLAVGVGFGAIGKSPSSTFENARNLAIGIGIQNFPEGLAVSLPLRGSGISTWKAFWYGQLSGMVEPIAGLLGSVAISLAEPLLPYALAFAAGAMVYVVTDDIIPEAQVC